MPLVRGTCRANAMLHLLSHGDADQNTVRMPVCNAHQQPLPHVIGNSYWLKDASSDCQLQFLAGLVPVDNLGRPWPAGLPFSTGPGMHQTDASVSGSAGGRSSTGLKTAIRARMFPELQLPVVYETISKM